MKVIIVGGTKDVKNIETKYYSIRNSYLSSNEKELFWPEVRAVNGAVVPLHPGLLFDYVTDKINELKSDEDATLFILTYSEYALNAARIAVIKDPTVIVKVYQYDDEGEHITRVNENGELTQWISGVYDTYDTEIDMMFSLR